MLLTEGDASQEVHCLVIRIICLIFICVVVLCTVHSWWHKDARNLVHRVLSYSSPGMLSPSRSDAKKLIAIME